MDLRVTENDEAGWLISSPSRIGERAELSSVCYSVPIRARGRETEIVRALADDPGSFADSDPIENSLRHLVGRGLLHRQGSSIRPWSCS